MARLTKKQTQELKRILTMLNEAEQKVQEPITPIAPTGKIYPKIPIALVTAQTELNTFLVNNQYKNQYGVTPQ